MESKNIGYCNAALKVLSTILDDGKKAFSFEEGQQIAGIYWRPIVQEMVEAKAGYSDHGNFKATVTANLLEMRAETTALRDRLLNEDFDRKLANEESACNIKYGRKVYRMSIIAIIVSSAAILLELAKWIWPKL